MIELGPRLTSKMTVVRSYGAIPGHPDTNAVAFFSNDAQNLYRYLVRYVWNVNLPTLVATLANPSTATHEILDPTVSGMVDRARRWGFGGLIVVNVFAFRSTDPIWMKQQVDPFGPLNWRTLRQVFRQAGEGGGRVIVGWGNIGNHLDADKRVHRIAQQQNLQLYALGVNQNGSPSHPLYLKRSIKPVSWPQPVK